METTHHAILRSPTGAQRPDPLLDEVKPTPTWRNPPRAGQDGGIAEIDRTVQQTSQWVRPLQQEIARVIVGQKYLVDRLLLAAR